MRNRFVFSSASSAGTGEPLAAVVEQTPSIFFYNQCQLHYWLSGPTTAPLVVLTHGEGGSHHIFDSQVQSLARSYRVLTWDIRGHGASQSALPFELNRAVDDLQALLQHTGYTEAIFVGVSAGGILTQLFERRFPHAVQGMALISCNPLGAASSPAARFRYQLTSSLLHLLPYWFVLAQIPAYLSTRPEVQKYAVESMKKSGRENFLAAWQACENMDTQVGMQRPRQALLIALGAYDRPGWHTRARQLWAQVAPDIRPVSVPGASHAVTQDNPAYVTKMLEDFLRQCVRAKRISTT
ncbi:MAG: alpha/beta hydrolase [Caldilineaceae bacterium]